MFLEWAQPGGPDRNRTRPNGLRIRLGQTLWRWDADGEENLPCRESDDLRELGEPAENGEIMKLN